MTSRISYVLPAYNQADVLDGHVQAVRDRLGTDFPGSEVVIVENGSTDSTSDVARRLAAESDDILRVIALESEKGLGHAMRAGVGASTGDLVVISGGLAFGFTDLDVVLAMDPSPRFAIGSKDHAQSSIRRDPVRRVTTAGFKVVRRLVLGTKVGDSQGSFLLDGDFARAFMPLTTSAGFVSQTEMVVLAELAGVRVVEVPVVLDDAEGASSVSPVRTSISMLGSLIRLRMQYPQLRRQVDAIAGAPSEREDRPG